jgi:hypothetical protein
VAAPLVAGLIPNVIAGGGWTIRISAIDAATGDVVSGVTVSDAALAVRTESGTPGVDAPMPQLVPVSNEV